MKKYLFLSLIMSIHTVTISTNAESAKFYGAVQISSKRFTDLDIKGSGHLTQVAVANTANIQGSAHLIDFSAQQLVIRGSCNGISIVVKNADISGAFECRNGQFEELKVRGACVTHDTKVSKELFVEGAINASELECPALFVHAESVKLQKSHVKTIAAKTVINTYSGLWNLWGLLSWGTHEQKTTEIYLDGGLVDSIIFQGEQPGRVILTHDAQVGSVTNGTIETR